MPIVDIVIASLVVVSVIIGFVRGFVKEAISIASLLIAIWAGMFFGVRVGAISEGWLSSAELQMWFGRILVFILILTIGGLIGWGLSKLVRLSILSGTDRVLGVLFGFGRGALLFGLVVIAGQFAGFDNDAWWERSLLVPYGEFIADWIAVMAPKGLEILQPDEIMDSITSSLSSVSPGTRG